MRLKNKKCYWCGKPATSSEHVPPENLFPEDKKVNLQTVPSCKEHNEDFTLLDERMRFYIQASCENLQSLGQFVATTLPSLQDINARGLATKLLSGIRPIQSPLGNMGEVPIAREDWTVFYEKLARGLHYRNFKTQVGGQCLVDFKQSFINKPATVALFEKSKWHFNNPEYGHNGKVPHPEIFQYQFIKIDNADFASFAVYMIFYSDLEVIVTFHTDKVTE